MLAIVVIIGLLIVSRKQPWMIAFISAVVSLFVLTRLLPKMFRKDTPLDQKELDALEGILEDNSRQVETLEKKGANLSSDVEKYKEEIEQIDKEIEEKKVELKNTDIGDRADSTAAEWKRRHNSG